MAAKNVFSNQFSTSFPVMLFIENEKNTLQQFGVKYSSAELLRMITAHTTVLVV